jgi:hypothetical protein
MTTEIELLEQMIARLLLTYFRNRTTGEIEIKVAHNSNEEWLAIVSRSTSRKQNVASFVHHTGMGDEGNMPFFHLRGDEYADDKDCWPEDFTIYPTDEDWAPVIAARGDA